jgi:hypothetical protein
VDYFNGGLFATVDPIELTPPELGPLFGAANENNWGYVQPVSLSHAPLQGAVTA